jgi:hypothetical protein
VPLRIAFPFYDKFRMIRAIIDRSFSDWREGVTPIAFLKRRWNRKTAIDWNSTGPSALPAIVGSSARHQKKGSAFDPVSDPRAALLPLLKLSHARHGPGEKGLAHGREPECLGLARKIDDPRLDLFPSLSLALPQAIAAGETNQAVGGGRVRSRHDAAIRFPKWNNDFANCRRLQTSG